MSAILDAVLYGVGLVVALVIYLPFSPMTIDLVNLPRGAQIAIHRSRRILWTITIAAFAALIVRGALGLASSAWLEAAVITVALLAIAFWSGYVPFVMTPPKNPRLMDADEADRVVKPDDVVLGLAEGGEAHAYPRDLIARPHFFPDTVAKTPFTVSYCILCNSAMAFRSELDGRPLALECVTAYNNNIIYFERGRGNYIQQLDGRVFSGPDRGKALEPYPLVQTSWAEWKRLHPETKLYYAPPATLRDKMVGAMLQMMIPVHRLARRKKPWHRIRGKLDGRLPAMSFVFGVELGGETCGYPVSALRDDPVLNDTVGGEAVVVFYDPEGDVGAVFSRQVDGRSLTFRKAEGRGEGIVAEDEETGSLWDLTGRAREGELAARTLDAVPHYNKLFWFSWALFKPETRVYAPG